MFKNTPLLTRSEIQKKKTKEKCIINKIICTNQKSEKSSIGKKKFSFVKCKENFFEYSLQLQRTYFLLTYK